MSSALVRKSLELFENDVNDKNKKLKKSVKTNQHGRGVHNHRNKSKHKQQKSRTLKSIRELHGVGAPKDNTEKNLQLLQRLSEAAKTEEAHTIAVFGRKSEDTSDNTKEESTLFTDADFEKFEKEYIFKS